MPKPTAIVVWFDDDTAYNIDPARVSCLFVSEAAAKECGHEPPFETPGSGSPIRGPIKNPGPPPSAAKGGAGATPNGTTAATTEGTCYLVNGVVVCP